MEGVCVTNASLCIVHIKFIIEPIKDSVRAAAKEHGRGGRGCNRAAGQPGWNRYRFSPGRAASVFGQ